MKKIALASLTLLMTVACGKVVAQPNPEIKNPILKFAKRQPDDIAVVTYAVLPNGQKDTSKHSISHNAHQPMPLASSMKIVVLAAYAKMVVAGQLDPQRQVSLAQWESFYIPGLDGGAHAASLNVLKIPVDEKGRAKDQAKAVSLDTLARFMIETSDNAATDFLITEIGAKVLKQTIKDLKLTDQEEFSPSLGQIGNWAMPDSLNTYGKLSLSERIALDWKKAAELQKSKQKREKVPDLPTWPSPQVQAQLASLTDAKGSAQNYADLMSKVLVGYQIGSKERAIMQKHLGWITRKNDKIKQNFRYLYAKGGSLPGILTDNLAFQFKEGPRKGEYLVVSIFMNKIPEYEYEKISASLQETMFRLAIMPELAQKFEALVE